MPYKNKEDQKDSSRKHYEKNKEKIKKRAREYTNKAKKRNRKFVDDYLKNNPCVDCNEKDIVVLEFDHVRGKKCGNIADGVHSGWSLKKLETEIKKCDVRCANCHRTVTHKRRKK